MNNKEKVYKYLDQHNIIYNVSEHPPIHTIDALEEYDIPNKDKIAKNLFLRNDNGKKHYLITIRQDKTVDLKDLREKIGSSRLSFASEERLMEHLGLTKGSVTPLGVINNEDKKVEVYFDKDLVDEEIIGVHPNENDATVWLSYQSIKQVIESMGNIFGTVDV
ncbi:MAG: prolyl-tRNA synthetase associated domain-containing protein [Clostridiaceae bacterium]